MRRDLFQYIKTIPRLIPAKWGHSVLKKTKWKYKEEQRELFNIWLRFSGIESTNNDVNKRTYCIVVDHASLSRGFFDFVKVEGVRLKNCLNDS